MVIDLWWCFFLWLILYRGVNDGFKVNTQTHLLPILATSLKVILHFQLIRASWQFTEYSIEMIFIIIIVTVMSDVWVLIHQVLYQMLSMF